MTIGTNTQKPIRWAKRRPRILHVISGLGPGGAETVLFRLISGSNDFDHEVICLGARDWYSSRIEKLGIEVYHLDYSSAVGAIRMAVRLNRLVQSINPDVVQCWMYRGNFVGGLVGRFAGKPLVWNVRSSSLGPLRLASRILARVSGRLTKWLPDYVINCSVGSARIHARLGYDAVEGGVIPNGYDSQQFFPDDIARSETRKALGITDEGFLIASIGRWHKQKGFPELLGALRLLRDRKIPVRLLMIGRGIDGANAELVDLIRTTGCTEVVQLIGERSDIPAIGRVADLHVLASIGVEGFPNVVAETMLSGTPNVVTDVGDSALIVGDTGWVVPPADQIRLADAIEQAYRESKNSSEQWRERRAAARKRIAENFSIGRMVQAYENVWTKVAAARAPLGLVESRSQDKLPPGSRRPLRVLHVINSLALGGAETLLYRLATRKSANEHIVVSLGHPSWYSAEFERSGVPLYHLNMDNPVALPRGIRRLNRIMRETDADVVQCWMYRSNVFGGALAKAAGIPIVWGIHCSSLEPLKRSSRALARVGGLMARINPDFIINCSTRSAELHARIGYSGAPGAVIHNGYDPKVFYPDEDVRFGTRQALGIASTTFLVGGIARWHLQKDIPNLLAAVRRAHDAGVPLRCLLIGTGLASDNDRLLDAIAKAGCRDFVLPLGQRSDIADLARAIDLHVLASCGAEAFPNVVAETMLCGVPNAVTDVGDSALMVGNSGWVVQPRDPDALANAIISAWREWKETPAQWAKRRKLARREIAGRFSIERMAEAYEKVWNDVAADPR
jgi:glycosyltransferase involved in cell wall biosynthesis